MALVGRVASGAGWRPLCIFGMSWRVTSAWKARTILGLAACVAAGGVLLSRALGDQPQAGKQPAPWVAGLLEAAERSGANFIFAFSPAYTRPALRPNERPGTLAAALGAFGLVATDERGVLFVSERSAQSGAPRPGFRVSGRLEEAYSQYAPIGACKEAMLGVHATLARAVVASVDSKQRDLFEFPWRPQTILEGYGKLKGMGAGDYLTMGGLLVASQMSEFQRRLCATIALANPLPAYPLHYLATSQIAFGDLTVVADGRGSWSPDLLVLNSEYSPLGLDLRMRKGPARAVQETRLELPARVLRGEELEGLLARAEADLPPPTPLPWTQPNPNFVCKHETDGPTRFVCSLLDREEADLVVYLAERPAGYTLGETLSPFEVYGYSFVVPPSVGADTGWYYDPGRKDGGLTLLTALNQFIYSHPRRLWKREGKKFTLVYDFAGEDRYREDPTGWLTDELLAKPVTLSMEWASVGDFIDALREQTGAPLTSSVVVSDSSARVVARLRHVRVRDLLPPLAGYLGGVWERGESGELLLVPRVYGEQDCYRWPRPVRPEEWRERQETLAGLILSLLVESLDERQKALPELRRSDLSEVSSLLLTALAQVASAREEVGPYTLRLSDLRQDESGTWRATLGLDQEKYEIVSVPVPTPPAEPLPDWFGVA